jgi:hypothetical protein
MSPAKPKATATAEPEVDVLADRPRWQTDQFLPALPTIRWGRLEEFRERHLALVDDLRSAVEDGDQASEDSALDQIGDLVLVTCRVLWQHFPTEGEAAFATAAAAVEPKSAIPDGSVPIAPTAATADEDRRTIADAVNSRAEAFDESYRNEIDKLADARRAFEAETQIWRGLYRRLEPVYLVREGAVCVDVREVERHRGEVVIEA